MRYPMLPFVVVLVTSVGPAGVAHAIVFDEQRVFPFSAAFNQRFGRAVAVDGTRLVVGDSARETSGGGPKPGGITAFVRSGGTWARDGVDLIASDAGHNDAFGSSVGISGTTIVAGAPENDDAGNATGAAYVFVRNGGWAEEQKLLASDLAAFQQFGRAVAVHGDLVVVGAPADDDQATTTGAVYLFTRNLGVWTEQAKLTPGDGVDNDDFGYAVATDGTTVAVGAPFHGSSGAIYVYGVDGTFHTKLTPTNPVADECLGVSVDVDADRIVAGDDCSASGVARVFVNDGGWSQEALLLALDAANGAVFGQAVGLSGTRLVVGAPGDDEVNDLGAMYVFERSGSSWSQALKYAPSGAISGGFVGNAIAFDGTTVALGAESQGAAWALPVLDDADADGIADDIDTDPGNFSNDFDDGTASGTIVNRGAQTISVTDHPLAGVRITTAHTGGGDPARVTTTCPAGAQDAVLDAGEYEVVTCSSVSVEVVAGPIFMEFPGSGAAGTLFTGNEITYDPVAMTMAVPAGKSTVFLSVGGQVVQVAGGDTVPLPSVTATPSPTPTVTPTATLTPTPTPSPTPTATVLPPLPPDAAKAAVKCQATIKKAGIKYVGNALKRLHKCVDAVTKCIQTKDDPDKRATCVAKAGEKCGKEIAKIEEKDAPKLTASIRKKCDVDALDVGDLLSASGLGFTPVCGAVASVTELAACVLGNHACTVEELLGLESARAADLIAFAAPTLNPLPCLIDRGSGSGDVDDPQVGKRIAKCVKEAQKAGRRFTTKKLKSLEKCVDAVFNCIQRKPGDEACLAKVERKCPKEFAKISREETKLRATVEKKCGDAPFPTLAGANGAHLSALVECPLYGVTVNSLADYAECLVRQHECVIESLLVIQAPRTAGLFAMLDPPVPFPSAFCP